MAEKNVDTFCQILGVDGNSVKLHKLDILNNKGADHMALAILDTIFLSKNGDFDPFSDATLGLNNTSSIDT